MPHAADIDGFLSRIATSLPQGSVTRDACEMAPWLTDWRGRSTGRAAAMVSPASTDEVAAMVSAAAEHGVAIVPQGGNTSMVAGATPDATGASVLLSLRRMDAIRAASRPDASIVAEAGVVLDRVHATAGDLGLRFPLSLAARGSATVGGLVSTNAGGTQVLRFGTMRAQVLGLEAVLPNGAVLDTLAPLRKDNRGYDLKDLLAGAEGTLGVVTAATLRLVPPVRRSVAWLGLADPETALDVLRRLEDATGGAVESFELVPAVALSLVVAHIPGIRPPLGAAAPWNVLVEIGTPPALAEPEALLAQVLDEARGRGLIDDAAIAQSEAQADAFWKIRESVPEAERRDGFAAKHDIAVPVSRMPRFIVETTVAVEARFAGTRVIAFGHLGDGNVHFNVRAPAGTRDDRAWLETDGGAITRFVHDRVAAAAGTISAEHGIGQTKRAEFARLGGDARLDAIRAIKAALDPRGIMNPGKLVPLAPDACGP